ncbi:hypothetical protein LIA77_04724 [Sarocladium implicatum]|nr:hypothetical protein LIA77_04724 [Sarocladium implicatum]
MGRSMINPFDKAKSSFAIAGRHYALEDIPEAVLASLLNFLRLPAGEMPDLLRPPQSWARDQERVVCGLDDRLRMPRDIISRAAIAAGKHSIKYFPEAAVLCQAHKGLDPRVIRNLMLLVGNETTLRTEKYRRASRDETGMLLQLPKAVEDWVDGMDAIAALWLGGNKCFSNIYHYPPMIDLGLPYIPCEACRLAIVGGNPDMLANLRISVMIRQQGYTRQRLRKNPRLAHILSCWYRQYKYVGKDDVNTSKDRRHWYDYIKKKSEAAIPAMKHARAMIVGEKHKAMRIQREYENKKPSSSSKSSSHHHSRPSISSAHSPRREKADKRAPSLSREQSVREETSRPGSSSIRASRATQGTQITEWPSYKPERKSSAAEDVGYVPSPGTYHEEHDFRSFIARPVSPLSVNQEPDRDADVDDQAAEDEFFEEDEDHNDHEAAEAANAWFKRRTETLSVTERTKLAQAIPAFHAFAISTEDTEKTKIAQALPAFEGYDAMSAVPEPLYTPTKDIAAGDRESWVSATVVTWKPTEGPPVEPYVPPRPSSSIYTTSPVKHRSTYRPRDTKGDDYEWQEWKKIFADDDALAKLEGRRDSKA